MKCKLVSSAVATTLFLVASFSQADAPVRNTSAELVLDFLTAADGVLDSMDDLLMDADPCDPDEPDVLAPVLAPDGHQITLGELSQVAGRASIKCQKNGSTVVILNLSGLIPNGVYTVWLLTFESPGFTPDFAHLIGEGSLGMPNGSSSAFVADAEGNASLVVRQPAGALSIGGQVSECLLDEFEFHLVGAYHPDGLTYGGTPGPLDEEGNIGYCYFIEHFAFGFVSPESAELAAARDHRVCWEFSQSTCAGKEVGSSCWPNGRCHGTTQIAPGVYNCECRPKGRRTCGHRPWRPC